MVRHRIKEIREGRRLSQEALGQRIGRTKSTISKLESGEIKLDLAMAKKIADALDVGLQDVLAIEPEGHSERASGFDDDAAEYSPPHGDPLKGYESNNQHLMTVSSPVLDKVGIQTGDIVIVDYGQTAVTNVKPLKMVVVRYHPTGDPAEEGVTLLRQFVPPSMLITNSSKLNFRQIDMEKEVASIVGVIESVHRKMSRQ